MSLNNEISHPEKVCKYCEISKPLEKFRPKSRMCNQCTNSRQNLNRIGKNRRYYLKHTEEIKARVKNYYYKTKPLHSVLLRKKGNGGRNTLATLVLQVRVLSS